METELFQDGGKIKREKDIYHHGLNSQAYSDHLPPFWPNFFSIAHYL